MDGNKKQHDTCRGAIRKPEENVEFRTHLLNRKRARCQRFGAAVRREEEEYPLWIFDRRATQQQRQRSATRRAVFWLTPGSVAPQSESAAAIFLRRALPAVRQKTARPFPIYEMSSGEMHRLDRLREYGYTNAASNKYLRQFWVDSAPNSFRIKLKPM